MNDQYIGLILAGGEGRRVNYANKGLLLLNHKPMIEHVLERLAPQVDQIIISANRDLECYQKYGFLVVEDDSKYKGLGPMAGIASVLPRLDANAILQLAMCDGPLLPAHLTAKLHEFMKQENLIAAYPSTSSGHQYGYFQAYVKALSGITQQLDERKLRIETLLKTIGAKPLFFFEDKAFFNCNSYEELNSIEREEYD